MTRKDYIKFAALFAGEISIADNRRDFEIGRHNASSRNDTNVIITEALRQGVVNVIRSTADIFATDNPRFDRDKFYAASGLQCEIVEGPDGETKFWS